MRLLLPIWIRKGTVCLLPFAWLAHAQAQAAPVVVASPRYQGFELPSVAGTLTYSITASERTTFGYNGEDATINSTNLSGNLGYLSQSDTHPFSMIYSGGFLGATSNQPSYFFQSLALSQVFSLRRWRITLADSVSYLPQTATSGLAGVPGIGDGSVPPVQVGPDTGQGILTQNSPRVSNNLSGSVERPITGSTALQGTASQFLLRYLGGDEVSGLDTNQYALGGGFNHRINARSSYTSNYSLSRYTFAGGEDSSLISQSVNLGYNRQLTREFLLNVEIGPQRNSGLSLSEPTYTLAANASLAFTGRFSGASIGYVSGTNNGSGVTRAARSQTLTLLASRSLGRAWNSSATFSYSRSSTLPGPLVSSTIIGSTVGGFQIGRALPRNLSLFFSYYVQNQSLQGSVISSNPINGLSQVLGTGITYAPSALHLGHR